MQKKKREVLFQVESQEHFQEKVSVENKKLICKCGLLDRDLIDLCLTGFDMHLAWCGRCDTMEQNYRSLFMRFDEDFVRMEFFSVTEEFIPEEILSSLQFGALTCKPRFVLFFEGEKKDEIDGADYTKLEMAISKHIPQLDD